MQLLRLGKQLGIFLVKSQNVIVFRRAHCLDLFVEQSNQALFRKRLLQIGQQAFAIFLPLRTRRITLLVTGYGFLDLSLISYNFV